MTHTLPSISKPACGTSPAHDSAHKHVSGQAHFIDDLPEYPQQLFASIGFSRRAHANIVKLDLSQVAQSSGVVATLCADEIPGINDTGPIFPGDPVLAGAEVEYYGQALFAVAAQDIYTARSATSKAQVEYADLPAQLSLEDALACQHFVRPSHHMQRGDASLAIKNSPMQLQGTMAIGGQDHFYLEGQIALAVPTEDGDMHIYSSTQHPSEVQHLVAKVLGLADNAITVEVRRMGGGFGGKETQATQIACIAALLANKTSRPVKLRLSRSDDMGLTGKRHDFLNQYQVGFDQQGRIQGVELSLAGKCGYSADLSDAIVDRAMFHADNGYFYENVRISGLRCKTNHASNTAFRGFGGPQGMMAAELMMDDIALKLGKDPLDVRKINFYGQSERNITPYYQQVRDNILPELVERLEQSSDYRLRRTQIRQFNQSSGVLKKGLSLTPVKFGISFTVAHLNQAGALLHVYKDGSVHLNHGGTEMGQGLFIKVAQVVADVFAIDLKQIKISATRTDKVPNTSATAASSGTDLNGKAAQAAALTIKRRMIKAASEHFGVPEAEVVLHDKQVFVNKKKLLSFAELAQLAYMMRVSLSATGFYKTPKIHYDREKAQGRPFLYFAYGAAVSEVLIDTLTGEYKVTRTDILHDVGRSINPQVDIGQIEGGFVQGMGWLTTEELSWDVQGRLLTNGPATYKIPTASDMPGDFRVELLADVKNNEAVIYRSKAVGEPPLMLAISVWCALRDAIACLNDYQHSPRLDTPATPERVLWAIEQAKQPSSPGS